MTEPISLGLQTLILVGMALVAVMLVQAGRWLLRVRARASILRAQEEAAVGREGEISAGYRAGYRAVSPCRAPGESCASRCKPGRSGWLRACAARSGIMTDPRAPRASAYTIRLLLPAEGSVSAPLQQSHFPGWKALEKAQERRSGDWWSDGPETDRSRPRAVELAWDEPQAGDNTRMAYTLRLTAQDGSGERIILEGIEGRRAAVNNLRIGTTYQWQVSGYSLDDAAKSRWSRLAKPLALSPVGTFRTHSATPRWIDVPGVTNVRDLGGWALQNGGQVRQGMLFRGSEMNAHCTITPAGKIVLEEGLGIRTDLDLRGEGEDRRAVLDTRRVAYHNIPLASYDMIASLKYIPMYRDVFALLADPSNYPVYLHCWGGADRTGTVAFLVGALLGMRAEDLLLDYELTSLSIWGERRADSEPFTELLQTLTLFASDGSTLQQQAERYARVIGVTEEEINSIKKILIVL